MKSRRRNFLSRWVFDCSFFLLSARVLSRRASLSYFILWSLEVNRRRMEKRFLLYSRWTKQKRWNRYTSFFFCHCQVPASRIAEWWGLLCLSVCLRNGSRLISKSDFQNLLLWPHLLRVFVFCFVAFNLIFRAVEACLWALLFPA